MKLASSILIVAVLLTLAKLAAAAEPAPAALGHYLFCANDSLTAIVQMEKDYSLIRYEGPYYELEISQAEGDVEVKQATDIGFTVKKKTTGAFLAFRERKLNAEDKAAGVVSKYHLQGLPQKLDFPETKSGTKILEALAELKASRIDAVIKCRKIARK